MDKLMDITSYLEQQITQAICDEYDVYSLDSLSPNQTNWMREQYYRALWDVVKVQYGERNA